MDKSCIFLFHLSTGDNFTMYAAVRHFQKIYKDVFIVCLHRNRLTVTQLYEPYKNVRVIIIDANYNNYVAPPQLIEHFKSQIKDSDLFVTGYHDPNFNGENHFWETFYNQLHLPYSMRYDYEDIHRNKERELNLYNSVISKYGEKYIFVHDHRNIKYTHYSIRANVHIESDVPVFHPNINYYSGLDGHGHGHLWNSEFMSDNLLDYCTLIENSTEIHISDSAFSCLMPFLDLKNVKKKCIHTDLLDIHNYHDEFKNWEIVKR